MAEGLSPQRLVHTLRSELGDFPGPGSGIEEPKVGASMVCCFGLDSQEEAEFPVVGLRGRGLGCLCRLFFLCLVNISQLCITIVSPSFFCMILFIYLTK